MSSNDPMQAMQTWAQAGQNVFQSFLQAMSAQQSEPAKDGEGAAAPAGALPASWAPEASAMAELQRQWMEQHADLWRAMMGRKAGDSAPFSGDKRFEHPAWGESPVFDYLRQAYSINADYVRRVAESAPVPEGKAKERLRFVARQIADAMSPSNFAATNPEFIQTALATNGESIRKGLQNLIADMEKGRISMTDESAFEVGRNLAVTPGAVVYENELIQLIQYSPLTEQVAKRPLLMVPPCINKFYIMDLQPENSLVRYAVSQGNTVFLVSWRNPKQDQAQLTWDDYLEKGPLTAMRVTREITGEETINVLGFCVGGTMLSSALSVAKARGDDKVASLTLLTTLLDFSDTGEIGLFVDEASVAAREATIGKGGLLRAQELASTFSALRANDLIWQYVVGNYLKGGTPPAFDLLFWNADSTNLPGPFAAWYLRHLYLENELRVPGKLDMCGAKADLSRVDMPAFLYCSREDHIVPWKAGFLSRGILGGESTFVLGASGHIAGVINPAAKNKRSHWINESKTTNADEWFDTAQEVKGSWWPVWANWLAGHTGGQVPARGRLGSDAHPPGEPAPGRYVKEQA